MKFRFSKYLSPGVVRALFIINAVLIGKHYNNPENPFWLDIVIFIVLFVSCYTAGMLDERMTLSPRLHHYEIVIGHLLTEREANKNAMGTVQDN